MSATRFDQLILAKASLSAFWLGEGANGTAAFNDEGPNGLDGTAAGSGLTYDVTGGLANETNTGVALAGNSDAATAPDDLALDLGDGPFWIGLWLARATTGTVQTPLAKGTTSFELRFRAGNDLQLMRAGGAAIVRTPAITDLLWHWYLFQKNGATAAAWQDGVDVSQLVTPSTVLDNTANSLRFGHVAAGSQRFTGSMARVAIGKGATLTNAEIAELWRAAKGILGIALETDTARPATPGKSAASGLALETDSARPITAGKSSSATIATETDQALPIAPGRAFPAGQAAEADQALAIAASKAAPAGRAEEADQALAITPGKAAALGQAQEADQALPILPGRAAPAGQAQETDEARPIVPGKAAMLGLAQTVEIALPISPTGGSTWPGDRTRMPAGAAAPTTPGATVRPSAGARTSASPGIRTREAAGHR